MSVKTMQNFLLPLKVRISFPNTFMSKCECLVDIVVFTNGFLESFIYSPDYLNSYPNDYEQVNINIV